MELVSWFICWLIGWLVGTWFPIKPGINLSTVLSSYPKGSDFRHSLKGMLFHVPNLVHWPRRSIAWFIKRKTIILIDINYTSSNAFSNVVRAWFESDPVTVGFVKWGFPQSTSHQEITWVLNAVTHGYYRMFGCFALSLLKEVFTNLAASTAVWE